MQVDYPIIDGDGHVVDLDREIRKYLPEKYHRIPDNREYPVWPQEPWAFGVSDLYKQDVPNFEMWLSFLEESGISATVLYPSNALTHGVIRRVDWAIDTAHAYNDWLYDQFSCRSERLKGVALLPVQDVKAASEELERCVRDYGFVGGMLPSVTSPLKGLGSREFDLLYSTAVRLDTMLAVHGGAIGGLAFAEGLHSYREVRVLKHLIPQQIQLTNMISQGVYDRFPELRVAYLEAGCGWVLFLMDMLDEQFERKGAQDLQKKPIEYLKSDNIFFSFESEERLLPCFIESLGAHKLIWASDYPHERPRSAFFEDLPNFFERKDISEQSRRTILYESSKRLYRIAI